MRKSVSFQESVQGFQICGLRSEVVELQVLPELGAKLYSLKNLRSGREWMWAPATDSMLFSNNVEDGFAQSTLIGGDECIPTIAACHWRGRELPDHGEAWSQRWDWSFQEDELITRLKLPISPLELQRTITLEDDTVHLRYSLRNLSDEPYEYIWALHPLMNIEDGDQIILPSECQSVCVDAAFNCGLGERGTTLDWPSPEPQMRLEYLDFGQLDSAVKIYTLPLSVGKAAIHNRHSGEYLRFSFDVQELNTLGIWINRGGWDGHHHIAIEPTNGAPDALDVAVNECQRFSRLEGGEIRDWSLQLQLGMDKNFRL